MIVGVYAAVANYFPVDVGTIRFIWVILLLIGGAPGIIPYIICWVVIFAVN